MILTEEQKRALERVVAYMDEMYAVASPYYGCTEDANLLRAMIDSSEHIREPLKMVGFDLKKAREAVHTLENFAFASGKITAGQIQDVLWGARLLAASAAEIERLRAIIDTPPEEGEWILDLEVIDRGTRSGLIDIEIAKKWHAAYRKAQNSNLLRKQENERLRAETEEAQESLTAAYLLGSHKKAQKMAARIAELEADVLQKSILCGSLAEICTRLKSDNAGLSEAVVDIGQERDLAQAEGKIGPDADAKPRYWQITEERKETLRRALEEYKIFPNDQAVLRAMLKEAL